MASSSSIEKAPALAVTSQDSKTHSTVQVVEESTIANYEKPSGKHAYVVGLYGILAIESLVWTYFQTFIPTLVSNQTPGPEYQRLLRIIFSVPFWNTSLLYNFFVILSLRNIAVSFLSKPSGQAYSATVIRRIVRMVIIMCAASGTATLIFSQIGVTFIDEFKAQLPNKSIQTPMKTYNGLSAFNSLFNLFWLTTDFYTQAANNFWPTATLWVSAVVYYQSFTTYFLMVILPFTRPRWHLSGLALFALGCFWMQSWGWYSATGLLLADIAVDSSLKDELKLGLQIKGDVRVPYWIFAAIAAAAGIALKYTFVVLPQFLNSMLVLHPYLDLSSSHSPAETVQAGPYPRIDDWLLIVGIMGAIELLPTLRKVLSCKPLVFVGERTFSIFVAQSIVFWAGGIKLWLTLREGERTTTAGANAIVLIVCLAGTAVFSELFYQLIDRPSRFAAAIAYRWLTS